jgi:carbon-monoxide dehydrogenase small subunit
MTDTTAFYELNVNGVRHEVRDSWIGESLLYVLRERLGLMGSKGACEQGECGSCTVLLDDDAVCSCLVLAASAVDSRVTTVEGLATDGSPSDVQRAFVEQGAVQCGFCTPGLIVAVHHLLDQNPDPTMIEVKEALSGNICRCTG